MSAVTQWFWKDKPAHKGIYQVQTGGDLQYAYWDGARFSFFHRNIEMLLCMWVPITGSNFHDFLTWRGLAEKPA